MTAPGSGPEGRAPSRTPTPATAAAGRALLRAAAEIAALKDRYRPYCADCGRPGYITTFGNERVMGHLNRSVTHPFRWQP